jgi:hypothetical protein
MFKNEHVVTKAKICRYQKTINKNNKMFTTKNKRRLLKTEIKALWI